MSSSVLDVRWVGADPENFMMCAGQATAADGLTVDEAEVVGSGSEGGKAAANLNTTASAEHIDAIAALLAGKPADSDVRPA
jgi:hypothetical protein